MAMRLFFATVIGFAMALGFVGCKDEESDDQNVCEQYGNAVADMYESECANFAEGECISCDLYFELVETDTSDAQSGCTGDAETLSEACVNGSADCPAGYTVAEQRESLQSSCSAK